MQMPDRRQLINVKGKLVKKKGNHLRREKLTMRKMVAIYCGDIHHSRNELCPECRVILDYALERIENCPLREEKPACSACPIHCYEKTMRQQVRRVMRHAGPRMPLRHPLLALLHLLDGLSGKRTMRKEKRTTG